MASMSATCGCLAQLPLMHLTLFPIQVWNWQLWHLVGRCLSTSVQVSAAADEVVAAAKAESAAAAAVSAAVAADTAAAEAVSEAIVEASAAVCDAVQ